MSTNNAFYNTLLKANDNLRKGRIGIVEHARTVGGVTTSMAAATTIRTLFVLAISLGVISLKYLLSDDEDKKERYKLAMQAELEKRIKSLPMKILFNMSGLSMFGQIFTAAIDSAIRGATKGWNNIRLSQVQTGNIFTDLVLDTTETATFTAKAVAQYVDKEKYKSGDKKGALKWKTTAKMAADDIVGLVALSSGLPYGGLKSDFYYPAKSGLSAYEKSLTENELVAEIKKRLRKEGGYERILIGTNAAGKKLYRKGQYMPAGSPHKGEEQKVAELRKELAKRRNDK
jgi:hypothetical protein